MSVFRLLNWSIGAVCLFMIRHKQCLTEQFTLVLPKSFSKTFSRDLILRHSFHIIQANFDQNPIFEFPLTDGHLHPILQSREYSLSNISWLSNYLQLFHHFFKIRIFCMRISYPVIILNLCRHKSGFIYRNPPFYATFLRMQLQIAPQICAYNTQRLKVPQGTSSVNCDIILPFSQFEMYKTHDPSSAQDPPWKEM